MAIFYHIWFPGSDDPRRDGILRIFDEQMNHLYHSGLTRVMREMFIGVSGEFFDLMVVASRINLSQVEVFLNREGNGELPTLKRLQTWAKEHPGWNVLYLHAKGSSYDDQHMAHNWRRCMMRACVDRWRDCVQHLNEGAKLAGSHWLTKRKYPYIGDTPYFGGNFWWARTDYLNTLPDIDIHAGRFEAEVWVGKGGNPMAVDLAPHFPMTQC
ncbi:MAG TPA: hypothetical protein PKJ00_03420 [Verrucomicrobiota bacterium]|nr:hypothetical protein [Verrucomicrobiota bacterium]HNS69004.1 hypothetical protein [Verrucomicrobiota bacterium]